MQALIHPFSAVDSVDFVDSGVVDYDIWRISTRARSGRAVIFTLSTIEIELDEQFVWISSRTKSNAIETALKGLPCGPNLVEIIARFRSYKVRLVDLEGV